VRIFFRHIHSAIAVLAVWLLLCPIAVAQDGSNVLLVINGKSTTGHAIAAHYARARGVPAENTVQLQTDTADEISRDQYEREIETPIGEWITERAAQDRILYIVLTKGVPLRIRGSAGRSGTVSSVDSELTLLYRRLAGTAVAASGRIINPYFLGTAPLDRARRFTHAEHDIYLVSRIDGFSEADAMGLVERGASATQAGEFFLDGSGTPANRVTDGWLGVAADRLAAAGLNERVLLDSTPASPTVPKTLLGFASLGSRDPANNQRRLGMRFAPGALASILISTDARSLHEPPPEWRPSRSSDPRAFFQGSPEPLSGDLIRDGVTGVAGHVAEPFVDGAIRPDVLFPAYVSGLNLAESFYLAMPFLSWQTVIFGDPLCAPFRTGNLDQEQAAPPVDAQSRLPQYFHRRRVAALVATGVSEAAAVLMLEGEALRKLGDEAGLKRVLEKATATDPAANAAHLLLATAYEKEGAYDLAIARYRLVLFSNPDDPVAANNLAYALAVYKNAPAEALPIAEKAHASSKGDARIIDTLGWIHHLLGNHAEAGTLIAQAATAAPAIAEIQLHLAFAQAALGRVELARAALDKSVQLDATFANREEVKKLRTALTTR
jgi:uncharacterized protein (TIGR03790 family)